MSNAGKKVAVHYIGTLDDGTKFDSSYDRSTPLEFICMAGQMIKGFDAAVEKMEVGETVNVHIPCDEAYGPYNEDLVQKIPVAGIPNAEQLPVGGMVILTTADGQPFQAKVVSVDDQFAVFDMNSEMAGKDLNFEITLLSAE
ncbi:MAG: peptidylprolyl isomerase [Eggerthellales bacterium]|nr:peptidylprolyl isomerase [Eggerthellales bacterium]